MRRGGGNSEDSRALGPIDGEDRERIASDNDRPPARAEPARDRYINSGSRWGIMVFFERSERARTIKRRRS